LSNARAKSSWRAPLAALATGGTVSMPLDHSGVSRRFGWVIDCFGVSWQLKVS